MAAPDGTGFQLYSSVRHDAALCRAAGNAALRHAGWNYAHASPYYMLDLHRDRLLRAAAHWGWAAAVAAVAGEAGLGRLVAALDRAVGDAPPGGPHRCRITLGQDGRIACAVAAAEPAPLAGLFPPRLPAPGFMTASPSGGGDDDDSDNDNDAASPLLRQMREAMGRAPYDVTVDVDKTASSAYTHHKTTRRHMYDAARQRAGIAGPEHKEVLLVNARGDAVMDGSISTVYFWRDGRWVTPPVPPTYDGSASGSGGLAGTTRRWALER